MACYYLVISSTHLSNGHFRRVKGVFRGPLCPGASDSPEHAERAVGCSLEDLKALYYCELCDKQYLRHQEFDNHIHSYDHAHKQRLKELKQREFARNVASKTWKDQRKQERALRRLHQQAQQRQETHGVANRQRSSETERRDPSPEDTALQLRGAPPAAPALACCRTHSCGSPHQLATSREARTSTSSRSPPHQRGRAGARLGVSFCFSRKGPRLEPSASVFSDHEEEEREKREQIRERIKKIIKDLDREMEEGNHGRCQPGVGEREATPVVGVNKTEDSSEWAAGVRDHSAEAGAGTHQEHVCVLGKDGATRLSWPVGLLKFTKSQPRISYSCNPTQPRPSTQQQQQAAGRPDAPSEGRLSCLLDTLQEEASRRGVGGVDARAENTELPPPDGDSRSPSVAVPPARVPSDSSDSNSGSPQEGRSRGARGIRESVSAAVSSELQPVTRARSHSVCIRLSRGDGGGEAAGRRASRGEAEPASFQKTNKPGRKTQGRKRDRESGQKKTSPRCRLRSVVMTVSAAQGGGAVRRCWESHASTTGGRRKPLAGCCDLLGRKRGPHRHLIPGSASAHCRGCPPLRRNPAAGGVQSKRGRDSVHTFSPARSKNLFWEKGHHSNPRSFIDCSYRDNSCNGCPARKRRILHTENTGSERSRSERRGPTGRGGRSVGWMRGNSLSSTEAEEGGSKAEWASRHGPAECSWARSPSPSSRYRSGPSPEETEWDGCSTDSWEDRGAPRRKSGERSALGCAWGGSDYRQYGHSPGPEWWLGHAEACGAEDGACRSLGSCSPRSSTSTSELSGEWSGGSASSGYAAHRKPSNPNGTHLGAPEHLPEERRRKSKPAPASLSCASVREPPLPVRRGDCGPPQHHVTDVSPAAPVSNTAPPKLHSESRPQKTAKTLPLIGKRPAIQKKERGRRKLLDTSEDTASRDTRAALLDGGNSGPGDRQSSQEAARPISFSVEEMDKYRRLQEEARKHMQKVLEQSRECAHEDITRGTAAAAFAPANPSDSHHIDATQAGPVPRCQEDRTSPSLATLRHIVVHSAHATASSPPPVAPPPQLSHSVLSPLHPSLTHCLHLSPLSISALLPSVFLSQHPIHLLRPCPAFGPLDPFSAVAVQPLNPRPLVDRAWPVRFQQKAL